MYLLRGKQFLKKNKSLTELNNEEMHFSKNSEDTIFIANEAHYNQVIERIKTVKKTLWIGTADIKDLYVEVSLIQKK